MHFFGSTGPPPIGSAVFRRNPIRKRHGNRCRRVRERLVLTFSTPQATWAAVASLIVPAAIFLAAIQLTNAQRLTISWLLLALGGVSLALGFLQAGKGAGAALHFYEVTNPTEAVGFFANRNHFAAYLFVTLVLGAVWHLKVADQMLKTGALTSRSILWLAAAAVFLVAILAGLAMAR